MIGCLPESYMLFNEFDLSGLPHFSGGFADVRMGAFEGKDVAVKSVRVSEMDDKVRISKVGNQATSSHLTSLTRLAALL